MDKVQLYKLERLGIDTSQCSIDIFSNLLDLCEFLYDEASVLEEDRMRVEINRLSRKPSN